MPEDAELATLSDVLWIDSVPVVRHFDRYFMLIRAVLLDGSVSGSSLLKITNVQNSHCQPYTPWFKRNLPIHMTVVFINVD